MAPATTTKPLLSSSASSSDRIGVGLRLKGDDAECSDSAASSLDHLAPICSSSPGASYNGAAALVWHDDGDTTDDQDEAGWQLVAAKSSHHKAGSGAGSAGGHGKAAVCGRCGMKGHLAARCRQPHCSRCGKWWHTEEECSRACHACGSLEHKISASTPLCKSYKCRECGLYGHVYAECPNIVCNLCKQVGHKALDCPSIICNLCKQQGHKAVNCPNPRGTHSTPAAGGSKGAEGKPAAAAAAADEQQQALKLRAAVPPLLRQSASSCGSTASPTSFAAAAAASSAAAAPSDATSQQQQPQPQQQQPALQEEVPLTPAAMVQPATAAELQARQQQQSQLLSQLYKAAPEAAVALLDNSSKLQALYCIQPAFMLRLLQSLPQHAPSAQQSLLESAVQSVWRQQQQQHAAAGPAASQQDHQHALRSAFSSSSGSTPVSPATPKVAVGGDVTDATQGIKPGDLAPQLAKQLVAEFGDMLPNRWQQLPSWRQLEARLSFPDGNYVQRRLQFREKRRQLQLLTLQMRAAAAAARQQQAAGRAAAGTPARSAAGKAAVRVVSQVPAAGTTAGAASAAAAPAGTPGAPSAPRPAGAGPGCSYAAALAGLKAGGSATAAAEAADDGSGGRPAAPPPGDAGAAPAAMHSSVDSSSSTATAVALQSEQPSSSAIAVCRRCGMMGHTGQHCAQPKCSRCHLWWHSEAQCASACQFCGSLDHQGDAEQPASCQSFRCKACKMFGHTASTCPHVQLHSQQEKARLVQQQQQQQLGGQQDHAQQQVYQGPGISPVATPTSIAAVPSSLSSSSNSISYQQLALQAPASPLSKFCGTSNCSSTWDSPLRPPDSPGLGQHGVKPKDLLPEHAKALQEEFPNALPPGWQQMASWRMVEERLRVVAVEGAVFSKRRQMWRDRRKHYQVLTAQALAAAARSAAGEAAAGPAAGEEVIAAVAQQGAAAAAAESSVDTAASCSTILEAGASDHEVNQSPAAQDQQQVSSHGPDVGAVQAAGPAANEQQAVQQNVAAAGAAPAAQPQQALQPQQQPSAPRQLALLQHRDQEQDLIPEWQQQRGSLFGLATLPSASGGIQLDGSLALQGGSTFSCDTASFCCSPMPAVTPSVLMSPLTQDALTGTPGPAYSGAPACVIAPAIFTGTTGGPGAVSRHASGALQQVPSSQSITGMSPRASNLQATTPMPTPRGAAAAAAAMAAAAAAHSGAPVSAAMGPYGVMVGPLPGDMPGSYSPAHYAGGGGPGVPPRGPMGYGMPQQSSPMPQHAGIAAAGRGMPAGLGMNMAGSPALYQQMLVAQRQSQLQQQLMLQSPYAPRAPPAAPEASPAGNQQMMMNMHLQQQQQQQHQERMQRQRRLFMAAHSGVRPQGLGQPEEAGETGELDDKLGVLGVLGLQ